MHVEICPTAADASTRAANSIAKQIREAVAERGRAVVAISGGTTPEGMMRELAKAELPWSDVHVFQIDERIVPGDDARRNVIAIRSAFAHSPLPRENVHEMPVDRMPAETAAIEYGKELEAIAGRPPRIDVAQLGLGPDGHTASLVPGDAALDSAGDVAITEPYQGTRRMTLTLKVLDRARCRVWLVTGPSKQDVVRRFLARDPTLIACRVNADAALVVLDKNAAGE